MGIASGTDLSEERIKLYIRGLEDLSEQQLKHGFDLALKNLGEYFPAIGQIRAWAESWSEPEPTADDIEQMYRAPRPAPQPPRLEDVDPDKCPAGWSQMDVYRAQLTIWKARESAKESLPVSRVAPGLDIEAMAVASGISSQQVAQWLEEGKRKQREHYARLEADLKWRAETERLGGFPGLTVKRSSVPADPEERRAWARTNAVRNGWIETREPGEEG